MKRGSRKAKKVDKGGSRGTISLGLAVVGEPKHKLKYHFLPSSPTALKKGTNHAMAPLLFFLLPLLSLTAPTINATGGFWSIDCGGTETFNTSDGIEWVGDSRDLVQTGERHAIPNPAAAGTARELATLRAFKSPMKKNCYKVPVLILSKVLVRVSFYYGNYDGLGRPPSFRLQFDANEWAEVAATMDGVQRFEAVYVAMGNGTSICFAGSSGDRDQYPFVSSIEVRSLARARSFDLYHRLISARYALYSIERLAFGADRTIRYPDDKYDRIWSPETNGFRVLKINATSPITKTATDDDPPEKALRSAAEPPGGARNLTIPTAFLLSNSAAQILINLYFTGTTNRTLPTTGGKRSFYIYRDGRLLSNATAPIAPPYLGSDEESYVIGNVSSRTVLELVPAPDSTLPPIISAMEVFRVSGFLSLGTRRTEVFALSLLQDKFPALGAWTGDPCLPKGYNWDWVGCSVDEPARITELHLSGQNLSGSLPDLSALDSLQIIDLQNNRLSGDVPEFLGYLPLLRELNLADNDFTGIPETVLQNKKIKLITTGNPRLCTTGASCKHTAASAGVINCGEFLVLLLLLQCLISIPVTLGML